MWQEGDFVVPEPTCRQLTTTGEAATSRSFIVSLDHLPEPQGSYYRKTAHQKSNLQLHQPGRPSNDTLAVVVIGAS
jgi:hypothetical protein